jgi:hypothetical protein
VHSWGLQVLGQLWWLVHGMGGAPQGTRRGGGWPEERGAGVGQPELRLAVLAAVTTGERKKREQVHGRIGHKAYTHGPLKPTSAARR